ncbi:MAG TPA: type II toxin-antitoxin system HicA family toxin [Chitinophagaceae bacterium]|nr:type II toxin-antitoxin system HicA family toxin [Chitinophagaceae bacterium]
MSKLPVTSAKELEKIILRLGFEILRQKGNHKFYKHPDGRYTTIPHHPGEDISRPLIRAILRQIEIDTDEYLRLLKEI